MSKIKSRTEFAKKFPGVYQKLISNNPELLCKYFPLTRILWTTKNIIEEAKKYTSRHEWKKKSGSSYGAALRLGILKICTKHMKIIKTQWDYNTVKKRALEFKSKSDWYLKCPGSHHFARANNIYDECTKHMKYKKQKPVKNLNTGKYFDSIKEAAKIYKINDNDISKYLKGKRKTAGGYHWAYCDEKGNIIK